MLRWEQLQQVSADQFRRRVGVDASSGERQRGCLVTGWEERQLRGGRFHLTRQQSPRNDTPWQESSWTWASAPWNGSKRAACLLARQEKAPHAKSPSAFRNRHPGASWPCAWVRGRQDDFHLFKQSQTRVHPSVPRHGDTGDQRLQKLHANTHKPSRATKKRPLTHEQKRANRQVKSQRVVIEQAILRLGARYRDPRPRFGLRLNLIAALTNLQS